MFLCLRLRLAVQLPVLLGLFKKAAESEGLVDGAWVSQAKLVSVHVLM